MRRRLTTGGGSTARLALGGFAAVGVLAITGLGLGLTLRSQPAPTSAASQVRTQASGSLGPAASSTRSLPSEGTQSPGGDLGLIHRIDARNGWVCDLTCQVLMVTDNAGATWRDATPPGATAADAIDFADPSHGWFLDQGPDPNVLEARLWRTTDAGLTWSAVLLPADRGANGAVMSHVSASLGFLLLGDATLEFHPDSTRPPGQAAWDLYRTNDGGATWARVSAVALPQDPPGVHPTPTLAFGNATDGFVGGTNIAYRTRDGGAMWSAISIAPVAASAGTAASSEVTYLGTIKADAFGPHFVAETWLEFGSGSTTGSSRAAVIASDDAGATWRVALDPGTGPDLSGWQAIDADTWIYLSGGTVSLTRDAGRTWTTRATTIPGGKNVEAVSFTTADLGWALLIDPPNCPANGGCPLRDSGTLAFTDDGGATWHVMGE